MCSSGWRVRRHSGGEELGFKRAQPGSSIQRAAGRMVSVSMGEKGKQKEYRGRQITLSPDKLD